MNDSTVSPPASKHSTPLALEILTDVILAAALFSWFSVAGIDEPMTWLSPLLFLCISIPFAIMRHRK